MKLQFKQSSDLLFIDKPAGFSTHSPDIGKLGICEIFERELKTKLYVVHRLDKTTTGSLVFAKSAEKAAELTELFQTRKVEKKYTFITDRASTTDILENSNPLDGKEAQTSFRRLKRSPFFELWEATPATGRAHQIRIHASQLGLPILGDETYGGSAFPHLCLHSLELRIPGEEPWITTHPRFMERLGLLKDPVLVQWISEIDRRQRLYQFLSHRKDCLRLIHLPEVRLDQFGDQLWFYWYSHQAPTDQDLLRFHFIGNLLQKPWLVRKMQNRGSDPNERLVWSSEDWQLSWQAQENGLTFQFHSENGQSPGLFLDQRDNRLKLREICKNGRVLNLFAYTCGFSVNAAAGQAQEICTVDLSGPFLEWGKQNFNLNGFDASKYEFFKQETLLFLKGTKKRNRMFDLIICDPPSFGRHKTGTFRLEQDLPELLDACWQCLSPGGQMLLSCNLEKWDLSEFQSRIQKVLKPQKIELGLHGWDFELPNTEPLMKSFWIQKRK